MRQHTAPPWDDNLTPLVKTGDPIVKLCGRSPLFNCRVLSEENFQFVKHRVNVHEDLVAMLQLVEQYLDSDLTEAEEILLSKIKATLVVAGANAIDNEHKGRE